MGGWVGVGGSNYCNKHLEKMLCNSPRRTTIKYCPFKKWTKDLFRRFPKVKTQKDLKNQTTFRENRCERKE